MSIRVKSTSVSVPLIISTFLLIALGLLYLLNVSIEIMMIVGVLFILSSLWLMARQRVEGAYLITLAVHLGPVLKLEIPSLSILTIGDLYLLIILIFFLIDSINKKIIFGPFKSFLLPTFFIALINIAFCPDTKGAILGFISIFQIALCYFFVLNQVKTDREANHLIQAIALGVTVSALMHIYSYGQGKTMLLSTENIYDVYGLAFDYDAVKSYIKTSFFYGSFIASCTMATVLFIYQILFVQASPIYEKVYWFIVGVCVVSSSLIQGSRTVFVTAIAVTSIMLLIDKHKLLKLTLVIKILSLALLFLIVFYIQQSQLNEVQRSLFMESFVGTDANTSMGERFSMWLEVIDKAYLYPKNILIGIGPDVPRRSPDLPDVIDLMYSTKINFQPYSFHNFYIDVLFQLGIFFLIIMLTVIFKTLKKIYFRMKECDDVILRDCFYCILAWLILWMSHATGWSKPVMILAQLFALAHIFAYREPMFKNRYRT